MLKQLLLGWGLAAMVAGAAEAPPGLGLDREARVREELPCAPVDGGTVTLNPPAFTFLPPSDYAPGRFRYTLEYAADPAFRDGTTVRVSGLTGHLHLPRRPLAPGVWYWRRGVERADGTVWGKTRKFTVPESAKRRPLPDFEALAAAIPRTRPRLFVTAEQLPELRRRVRAGEFDELLAPLKKLVLPSIGAPLSAEPGDLPPRGPGWGEAYQRINRNLSEFRRMEESALLYLLTGEKPYGLEAKRRLLHFFGWDPEGPTSLKRHDDQAMWMMRRGVAAYDWTADLFTPEEQRRIERCQMNRLEQYCRHLRRRPIDSRIYDSHDNGYLYNLGEALVSWLPEHPELRGTFVELMTLFHCCLPIYGGDDGGWNEGPAYWGLSMDRILRFLYCVKNATGWNPAEKPFFANTGYYIVYGWPGRSRQSSFGDGPTNMSNQVEKARIFALLTGNRHFLKPALDRGQAPWPDILNVLAAAAKFEPPDLSGLPPARLFRDIGLAVMRTDLVDFDNDVGLLFQSNPFGLVSHHLNAQNCFLLEAYGEPLAISSGYYDYYGSPHHAGWTRETRAHCGITLDGGRGQRRDRRSVGRIEEFFSDGSFDCAVGDATAAYDGRLTRSRRTVVHVRPGVFVLFDENDAAEPHTVEFNLHALRPIRIDEAAQSVRVTMPNAELDVRFFADRPWRMEGNDRFDPPPPALPKYPKQFHFRASEPSPLRQSRLLTVLRPVRAGQIGSLPELRPFRTDLIRGVEWREPDGGRVVVGFATTTAAAATEWAGIRVPGRVLALRLDAAGRVRAVYPGRRPPDQRAADGSR